MSENVLQVVADHQAQYRALTEGAGLADFGERTLIELTGKDRASFLHNLCTNDIRGLQPGQGCEMFLTDVKGKILGYTVATCGDTSLVLDTVGGQANRLLAHLDRYLIREDVQLHDRSETWSQMLLAGDQSAELLKREFSSNLPAERLAHGTVDGHARKFDVGQLDICRTDFYGPVGFLLRGPSELVHGLAATLAATAVVCGPAAVETVRIEAGTPRYGVDIGDDNLPQEAGRDRLAISFTKGCYLGQETVARIDALGHVNRLLCGIRFDSADVPACGTELSAGGQVVGRVTSATFSPQLAAPLALGYLRRGHTGPGTRLDAPSGSAEVVPLPVGER